MRNRYLEPVLAWYGAQARDLPWRRPGVSPWAVMVSEFMLQQTPVSRVLQPYAAWMERWPDAPALAASPPGDAVRQWGTLGYPRRALRLHETARILTENNGGQVPDSVAELVMLPGVGAYTAAAVASFAYRQRHAVLDTNVRRVLARLERGQEFPSRSATAAETVLAQSLLPREGPDAARWSVAVMELGALVCTAAKPRCPVCPVAAHCSWRRSGAPAGLRTPGQPRYEGSDRQCRGRLLAVLRGAGVPVGADQLAQAWPDAIQRARALDGLVADGLAEPLDGDRFALPA
jgi:A/G-specific adenine glycosylase